jgi:integrase
VDGNFTAAHRRRLKQWVPFALIAGGPERVALFEKLAEHMDWSPRTQATYFACLQSTLKLVGVQQTQAEVLKNRRAQAAAREAPHWDLEDDAQVLSNAAIAGLEMLGAQTPPNSPANAALLTLYLGQRMGDVLKLERENIYTIAENIVITFKEGKTVSSRGPYSLMVERSSRPGQILTNIARQWRRSAGKIFPENAEELFKRQLSDRIDIRALRRTGLIRLGLAGATQEQLLFVSRHASLEMLNLYLHNGMFNIQILTESARLIRSASETHIPCIGMLFGDTDPTLPAV